MVGIGGGIIGGAVKLTGDQAILPFGDEGDAEAILALGGQLVDPEAGDGGAVFGAADGGIIIHKQAGFLAAGDIEPVAMEGEAAGMAGILRPVGPGEADGFFVGACGGVYQADGRGRAIRIIAGDEVAVIGFIEVEPLDDEPVVDLRDDKALLRGGIIASHGQAEVGAGGKHHQKREADQDAKNDPDDFCGRFFLFRRHFHVEILLFKSQYTTSAGKRQG